ncbi:phage protease [Shewanella insulae]|uniref:phage protease n=1 Tax=Shewanella insulae TaxID=2681496 RepID=UPI001EFD42FF|nr:phage protease [Shewanella insulae]MCG9755029.1 phage protease [Shewanella insulae]
MKTNTAFESIAALTAQTAHLAGEGESLAALNFTLAAIGADNTGADNSIARRVQLLPDGLFSAKDGRPFDVASGKWLMDEVAFAMLQANANARENDFHFDYEHQTLNADENGKPAPAAGWFKQLEYVPGEGVFALDVDWTAPAAQYIANKEYRYVSAVFAYDTQSGRPTRLLHVALTNDPALDGMKAIAALKAGHGRTEANPTKTNPTETHFIEGSQSMNEALKLLLGLIGIDNPGDLSNEAALKAATDKAETAIAALKIKADRAGTLETELNQAKETVTALKAQGGNVDLSKYVPKATYDAQVTAYAALKAGNDKESVTQLLKDNVDKVFESETDYLTSFAEQQGVAALKSMLEARPSIAALKTTQTQGKDKPDGNEGELTAEELAVCKHMGITAEEYKAAKV